MSQKGHYHCENMSNFPQMIRRELTSPPKIDNSTLGDNN